MDSCKVNFIDEKKVESIRKKSLPDATIKLISETFKILGDPTRVKIVFALSQEELCVCDIANLLGATKSAISHQLRILRNMRIVTYRKNGKMVYYTLDDNHMKNLFDEGLVHVQEL